MNCLAAYNRKFDFPNIFFQLTPFPNDRQDLFMVSVRKIFILHPKISILWQCHWISLWSENGSLFIESDPFSDHESTFCFLNFVTLKEPLVKFQGWKMFNMDQTWRWASIKNSYIHLGGANLTFKIRFFHVFREIWKRGNFVLHISLWKQHLQR